MWGLAAHGCPEHCVVQVFPTTAPIPRRRCRSKGTLRKSCRSLDYICLITFLEGRGAAGNGILRKKAILGQAYLRNTFFFLSALSISGITGLCQEACSRAELRTCVCGSWELGGRGGRRVVLKCPRPSGDVWAAEDSEIEMESQENA